MHLNGNILSEHNYTTFFIFYFVNVGFFSNSQYLQWFDWWASLAGNDLHEFKAAVVELDVSGIVILCVDLTGPQRTAVLRLNVDTQKE